MEIGVFTKNIKIISSNVRYNDNNIKRISRSHRKEAAASDV
ncbi:hypothetical protein [Ruminococcus sp.]